MQLTAVALKSHLPAHQLQWRLFFRLLKTLLLSRGTQSTSSCQGNAVSYSSNKQNTIFKSSPFCKSGYVNALNSRRPNRAASSGVLFLPCSDIFGPACTPTKKSTTSTFPAFWVSSLPNVLYILDNTGNKTLSMFAAFLHSDPIPTSSLLFVNT